jgi:hypothetical protein
MKKRPTDEAFAKECRNEIPRRFKKTTGAATLNIPCEFLTRVELFALD